MNPLSRRAFLAGGLGLAEDRDGLRIHKISSEYQAGETELRVLLPNGFNAKKRYRALYVLSVDIGPGYNYGDPLDEIRKSGLHTKHSLVCAYATFSESSWYADNPLNPKVRQESYFLRDVVPLVEREHPVVRSREGRLLVGFSKSGWGAY